MIDCLNIDADHSERVLPALVDELHVTKLKLQALREAIELHKRTIIKARFGVWPGVLVRSKGQTYRVAEVSPDYHHDKPWLRANMQKKNGEFSTRLTHLYNDWLLVK